MKLASGLLAGAVLAIAAWWFLCPDDPAQLAAASDVPPSVVPVQHVGKVATAGEAVVDDGSRDAYEAVGRPDDSRHWNAVKRYCPWPPEIAAWEVIDPPCLSALNAMLLDDEWRRILADPSGTRRAVVVALDDHQCRVPSGESRPELYEACAAEEMVLLAELHRKCLETAHENMYHHLNEWPSSEPTQWAIDQGLVDGTLAEYLRRKEMGAKGWAVNLWEAYMCRADIDALAWVEALPEPPDDLAYAGRQIFVPPEDGGTSFGSLRSPRLTQDAELYALARRLGAEVPDWVQDDVLPW